MNSPFDEQSLDEQSFDEQSFDEQSDARIPFIVSV